MPLSAGEKLGPYEILALIGAGGMGEVYKARDTRLDRIVAVKTSKVEFNERFEREARAVAALSHPNICTLFDVGPNYLVMEFVEGAPLKGPLPLDEVLRLGRQIAAALEAAHEKHITHRDLKPGNIMLKPDGTVKVLDFGLAKWAPPPRTDMAPANSPTLTISATAAGMIMGTAAYMAPEQAKGKEVDKRADIWSFGVVLYELVTGASPFHGTDVSEILASVIKEQPNYAAIPPELRRLIRKCLDKEPAKRLRDIGDAWELLEEQAAVPVAVARPASRWPWVASAALCATTAIALWAPWRTPPKPPELQRLELVLPVQASRLELSPDGRLLAFGASGATQEEAIWVRPLNSSEPRLLAGTEGVRGGVFWSPDSRFIAFGQGGKLKRIEVSSGVISTILEDLPLPRGGSWNRNGILIVGSPTGIQRISLADGKLSQLTRVDPAKEVDHLAPRFLPDQRHFVYIRNSVDRQNASIAAGSTDNAPEQQPSNSLAPVQFGTVDARLSFIPASAGEPAQLLFRRSNAVLTQAFNVDRLTLTGEPAPLSEGRVFLFTAIPGVLVYNRGVRAKSQLALYARDGQELAKIGAEVEQYSLSISPDGSRIAIERNAPTQNIWSLEFNREAATKLATDARPGAVPIWSPDGSQIAFRSFQSADLLLKSSKGEGEEKVLEKGAFVYPQDWSHDGKFILCTIVPGDPRSPKTAPDLMVLPMEGGSPGKSFPYLATAARETQGMFSRDDRWVAYVSDETGARQVYVGSFPEPKFKVAIGEGDQPRWSRDGKELFYFAPDDTLMAVDFTVTGGIFKPARPKPLFKIPVLHNNSSTFGTKWDIAPGGRFLINAAIKEAGQRPVNVVLNWEAGLKK